jgi:hypothetical protein
MKELLVFVAQYSLVFLLGLQSRFVRDSQYTHAIITSLLLGITGYYVTMQIAIVQEMFNSIWYAYILGGPFGIMTSIYIHNNYFNGHKYNEKINDC